MYYCKSLFTFSLFWSSLKFTINLIWSQNIVFTLCSKRISRSLEPVSLLLRHLLIRKVVTTTLYHVTAMLWYHMKHHYYCLTKSTHYCEVHNRLLWQHERSPKPPHMSSLLAYISKNELGDLNFYCRIVIS